MAERLPRGAARNMDKLPSLASLSSEARKLEENQFLIMQILYLRNTGKEAECAPLEAKLHSNLSLLCANLDAQGKMEDTSQVVQSSAPLHPATTQSVVPQIVTPSMRFPHAGAQQKMGLASQFRPTSRSNRTLSSKQERKRRPGPAHSSSAPIPILERAAPFVRILPQYQGLQSSSLVSQQMPPFYPISQTAVSQRVAPSARRNLPQNQVHVQQMSPQTTDYSLYINMLSGDNNTDGSQASNSVTEQNRESPLNHINNFRG